MTLRAALHQTAIAAVMVCATAPLASLQAQGRQAESRQVDNGARQPQGRETEAPKPIESPRASEAAPRAESRPSLQRQAEPQRQPGPQRQAEPQRQPEAPRQQASQRPQRPHDSPHPSEARRQDADHWRDPGPAWRDLGPAWRNLNERPTVQRPGQDAFRAKPGTYDAGDRGRRDDDSRDRRRRDDESRNGRSRGNRNVYIAVPYLAPYDLAPYYLTQAEPGPAAAEPAAPLDDEPALGFLQLRVSPRTADVYVDGTLAGTVDDFGGRGARMLAAGPHRVEIVAEGYETLTFDVRVVENDTVTFTRDLEPRRERTAPEPAVIPHKAFYVVPQCYIGDRPPQLSDMPAGCRVEDVRVIP
jgi:hypothetical protein